MSVIKISVMVILCITISTSYANTYFVAKNGDDNNIGTLQRPFLTIQKAANIMVAGDICYIREGIYRETITPINSGTITDSIRFARYNNEVVVVSGADMVTSGWSIYRNNIYQTAITLPVNGYANEGFFANQLFINGEMMTEARWPNNTNVNPLQPTNIGAGVNIINNNEVAVENNNIPDIGESWVGATFWTNEWYTSYTGTITRGTPPTLYATPSAPYFRNTYWFYLTGKLGLLDAAREWHYDGTQNTLYFWAPNNGIPANVEVKRRNYAFDFSNKSYISVTGIEIFASTITTSATSKGIVLDRIKAKYISHHVTLPPLPTQFHYPPSGGDLILASHCHDTGIKLIGENHVIKNSNIAFSSGNGILLEGTGHLVENNFIHHINYQSSYAAPVRMNGNNHRILKNSIYECGRGGIEVDWHTNGVNSFNNEIAYNDISSFGALSSDLGGIYFASGINMSGTTIHHNYIHNPYGYSLFWDVAGIYLDNDSYNAIVHHNLIADFNRSSLPKATKIASQFGTEKIYNNTFLYESEVPTTSGDIRNNIFKGNVAFTNVSGLSNNLYSATDPKFKDAANADYTLLAGSPAIDQGVIINNYTDGFIGQAPDIGAFEFGVTPWQAGATELPLIILPVDIEYFTARKTNDNKVQLQWKSSLQNIGDKYIVERSGTGLQFMAIDEKVISNSFNINEMSYFTDNNPLQGVNYYRLRLVKQNNTYFSEIRNVLFQSKNAVSIFPNPIHNEINVSIPNQNKAIVIELFNNSGAMVLRKQIANPNSIESINVSAISNGIYYLVLKTNNETIISHNIIKQ